MFQTAEENLNAIAAIFRDDSDFVAREFQLPSGGSGAVVFIDGLASPEIINDFILKPLMNDAPISIGEAAKLDTIEKAAEVILDGDTVVFLDGFTTAAYFNTKGFPSRTISEPQTETVLRGPREGFTESMRTNTALLRRKLKTPDLRIESLRMGKRTRTTVCLCWLDSIAAPDLIDEVRKRIDTIDVDAILGSGYVEEFIEDDPLSPFQTIGYSEKPDVVAAKLLEGRCALIIDGTPFALTMPFLFIENFQSPEDYSIRPLSASFLRLIRIISFPVTLTLPALYVALVNFHSELIPTALLYTIAAASEGTPFSAPLETAVMLLIFEILREAGIRLPKPTGQAISIVGALVMGQAAIEAGIVGAPVVIIIAFCAVASFVSPTVSDAANLMRWVLLLLGATMGGFGILLGVLSIYILLASTQSFGAMYLHPIAPLSLKELGDTVVRIPMWMLKTRPSALRPQDKNRRSDDPKPDFSGGISPYGAEQ
ncbi:MAG: spore germination protein [Oscillospiraceae bacterium]|jgi:spore germination protein KA|nr:spore germination protein [Oscillospiraceae bacterium]